ncbi:hypothetical protein PG997_012869 [Apiospora hydei]|uniref:2EXR domain-containing protein n=1 Tax=Apiospora hydei TaxID=1337664 RepID=A0ABR1V4K5_9PEZI
MTNSTHSSTQTSLPLMSFQYFPQLPCELRLEIWSYALASEAPTGHEYRYYPSTLFTTNREARREAQNHYSVKIQIIDLEKAEKIVEKWYPKIPGETVRGEGSWHKCCQLLEHMPRQLQGLVTGCIYLSTMSVYDLELRYWFSRRTVMEPVEFAKRKYTLHSTAHSSPTALRELKSTMDLRLKRYLGRDYLPNIMRNIEDIILQMKGVVKRKRVFPFVRDWNRSLSKHPWDPDNPILTERAFTYLDEDLTRWQATMREKDSTEQEHNNIDGDGTSRLRPSRAMSQRKHRAAPARRKFQQFSRLH